MPDQTVMSHLRALAGLGARPIGSVANQTAADYICRSFSALGYAVEEQPYACTAFDSARAELTIDGQPAAVEANAFSLPCNVRGAVLPLGSLAELDAAEIEGRILLFYGELAQQALSPKSWFLK
ncbi:MAG TPA: hypothetical protein VLH85_09320, partial [Levilinea sp.]|nr:hypothetical protein [Levilinea sp.]